MSEAVAHAAFRADVRAVGHGLVAIPAKVVRGPVANVAHHRPRPIGKEQGVTEIERHGLREHEVEQHAHAAERSKISQPVAELEVPPQFFNY